jgi:phage shock protein A
MAQQSILGRITQLARANINSLLDSAEDPQMMLDQMIRDYTQSIREAEESVAQTIGNLRLMEEDSREAEQAAGEWGAKAAAASTKGDEMRSAGNTGEADRFDGLARVALQKQLDFEQRVQSMRPTIEQQRDVVDKLKVGLEGMRGKLEELRSKRDELVARARVATAQQQVQVAVKGIDMADPTSELARFEERIRREEAQAQGQAELAASSMEAQFDTLDDMTEDAEVESRLAALKSGR